MICVVGEILFDEFPSYKQLGGAPFNFAYHLKNLGFPVRFISKIGNDANGKKILSLLEKYQFNTDYIQIDGLHPTGTVAVKLDKDGVPQFDIINNVAYDYIEFIPKIHIDLIHQASLVYFGSLAQRSPSGFKNVQKIIGHISGSASCLYDINLRPGCYNDQLISQSLLQANIIKLNQEELQIVKRLIKFEGNNHDLLEHLLNTFQLEIISLTKGSQGSELYTEKGTFSADAVKTARIIDTVGAGDAYAAILAAGLMQKMSPELIMQNASAFSSAICGIKGAIPENRAFYKPFQIMFDKGD